VKKKHRNKGKIMECPKCKEMMEERKSGTVEIDYCSGCGGTWFDKNELREVRNAEDTDLSWMEFDLWVDNDKLVVTDKSTVCPSCGEGMPTVGYADTGVEIEYCIKCGGIWLDKDEFTKIIDALEEDLLTMTSREYLEESMREVRDLFTEQGELKKNLSHLKIVLKLMEYRILAEHHTIAKLLENFTSPFG